MSTTPADHQKQQQQEPKEDKDISTIPVLPSAEDIFLAVKANNVSKLQQIVSTFIENKIDPKEKFNSARTIDADSLPLVSYALVNKARDSFCFLLNTSGQNQDGFCCSPFLLDEAKWNALTHAVESNNVEAVKILLDCCCITATTTSSPGSVEISSDHLVNQRTTEDWFPLTYAICNGNVEIVKMLLQVPGIDLTSKVDDLSHKEIAEMRKYLDIVKMLEEKEGR